MGRWLSLFSRRLTSVTAYLKVVAVTNPCDSFQTTFVRVPAQDFWTVGSSFSSYPRSWSKCVLTIVQSGVPGIFQLSTESKPWLLKSEGEEAIILLQRILDWVTGTRFPMTNPESVNFPSINPPTCLPKQRAFW